MNTKQGYLFKPNAYILEMFRTGKCILNPACHKFFAKLHLLSNISKTNIGMQLCGKKRKIYDLKPAQSNKTTLAFIKTKCCANKETHQKLYRNIIFLLCVPS